MNRQLGITDPKTPSTENLTHVKFGRMDTIRGKTIAITGAARGIGYATAKALLARGARVVIGDRDVALQESAVVQLTKLGQVSGYPLDVTDRESFASFLAKARTDGGGHVDVLINNAGVMPIGPFLDQSEQAIRSSIEVNLYGVIAGCQLVLPDMIARRSGHIINIASLSGLIPVPGPGGLRRREVRRCRHVRRAGRRGRAARCRRLGDHAAVHQHRAHLRNQDVRRHQAGRARGHRKAVIKMLEKPKTHVSRADSGAVLPRRPPRCCRAPRPTLVSHKRWASTVSS